MCDLLSVVIVTHPYEMRHKSQNIKTVLATYSDSMHQELSFDVLHLYVGAWEVFENYF